jgi:hypothetical protein
MLSRSAAIGVLLVGCLAAIIGGGLLLSTGDETRGVGGGDEEEVIADLPPEAEPAAGDERPTGDDPDAVAGAGEAPKGADPSAEDPGAEPATPKQPKRSGGGAGGGGGGGPARAPAPAAPSITEQILAMMRGRAAAGPDVAATPTATGPVTAHPPAAEPPGEPGAPAAPPKTRELIVPSDTVVEVEFTKPLSTAESKPDEQIQARVRRNIRVGEELAIPENAKLNGTLLAVDPPGRIKGRGGFEFQFHTLVLPDNSMVAVESPRLRYDGPNPTAAVARKAGGAAVGGAVVGILLGGTAGAAKGAAAGAGAATAGATQADSAPVVIPTGAPFDVRLRNSFVVHVPVRD